MELNNSLQLQDNNNNLLQVLMDTKSALIAAQRESKRLKRRTAREVAELERVAEEQCNRAGDLTEQLSLARRQYAQLKSQVSLFPQSLLFLLLCILVSLVIFVVDDC
ncbi:unnamed protein product [Trichobilharzia regenti]|nr:unnamed protein product [Trichobilharzia regenti]